MSMNWSRRQVLRLGGLSTLAALSGCTSVPFVGSIGFMLRNYTDKAYDARIQIKIYGQTAFEQVYQLPAASGADPYVHKELDAVSNVPSGVTYVVSLFLDGTEAKTINATMDCTDRETQQIDEEIDINIGFGRNKDVLMADSSC